MRRQQGTSRRDSPRLAFSRAIMAAGTSRSRSQRRNGRPARPRDVTIAGERFANGVDVSLYPNSAFPDQSVDAETVFVGYGLDAPEIGSNDYDGLDVRGKIVVALWGYPKGAPSEVGAHLLSEKPRMAKDHGAVGLLQLFTPSLCLDCFAGIALPIARTRRIVTSGSAPDGNPNYPGPNLPLHRLPWTQGRGKAVRGCADPA